MFISEATVFVTGTLVWFCCEDMMLYRAWKIDLGGSVCSLCSVVVYSMPQVYASTTTKYERASSWESCVYFCVCALTLKISCTLCLHHCDDPHYSSRYFMVCTCPSHCNTHYLCSFNGVCARGGLTGQQRYLQNIHGVACSLMKMKNTYCCSSNTQSGVGWVAKDLQLRGCRMY